MVKAPLPLNASTNGGDASRVGFFSSLVPHYSKGSYAKLRFTDSTKYIVCERLP